MNNEAMNTRMCSLMYMKPNQVTKVDNLYDCSHYTLHMNARMLMLNSQTNKLGTLLCSLIFFNRKPFWNKDADQLHKGWRDSFVI